MSERRDIFLRAHTVKASGSKKRSTEKKPSKWPKWPEWCLLFDTETRIVLGQALMFGIYQLCRLIGDQYVCEEEGIFYSNAVEHKHLSYAAVLAKEELNAIGTFVGKTISHVEVPSFPPKTRLVVHASYSAFMEKVFWKSVQRDDLIVCFNSPFDLSRLAQDWRRGYKKRGFSLIMSRRFGRKTQQWETNIYRPVIHIEALNAKTAAISRGQPFRPKEWPNPGRFADLSTILFSMYDKHYSLNHWCQYFGIPGKLDHEPSGRVTAEELSYCRNDVNITRQLLNCAKREFDLHPLPELHPDKAYSPAVIAKAYLREMNLLPPKDKFEIPDDLLGFCMQSYSGGRAEIKIRRTKVPVIRVDFVSQYPTVNALLQNWEILTAESLSFPECTEEIRAFLEGITLDKCFNPMLWPRLRFWVLVKPDKDIFPVRAPYDPRRPDKLNIAVDYFSDDKPVWFAGPEIIAAVLLSGKVPQILRAFKVVPHGKQAEMRPVELLGSVHVDPYEHDFFKRLIEERKANEGNKVLKHALKIIANSGAYGIWVQLDERHERERILVDVFSGEHHDQVWLQDREAEGPWYFPPVASLITAGGRLLLAMAEKCVTDAGGLWLMADTDSFCIVSTKNGGKVRGAVPTELDDELGTDPKEFADIPALSHAKIKEISERFTSLNPYSFGGTILKIEDINYEDGDPQKPLRTLMGYAISAKRYCLFRETRKGVEIIDAKGHGLGYLMSPKSAGSEEDWIKEAWLYVLQLEGVIPSQHRPDFLDRPAMMRIPVTSPAVLGRLKYFVKPYDFVLSPIVDESGLDLEAAAEKPTLVTRFLKNSDEWLGATYYNVRDGKECRITVGHSTEPGVVPVVTYGQILTRYMHNPESKFLGPDGRQCAAWTRGVLQRMHVIAEDHFYCGKETKRKLEHGVVDHEIDFHCKIYANGRVCLDESLKDVIRDIPIRELMRRGIGQHTIEKALFGTIRARTRKKLLEATTRYRQELQAK